MRNRVLLVLLIAVLLLVHPASGHLPGPLDTFGSTSSQANAFQLRTIVFPVAGPAAYNDTFGACRDGCTRSHQGVDIFAPKLTPLIAAADGRIVSERRNATNKAGNKLVIEDAAGWRYVYLHLNNDTPGTDDNANPQSWIAAGDVRAGDTVRAGQVIGYLGDSGNAEETPPHLHFEIIPPGQSSINPTPAVTAARGRGDLVAAGELWLSDDIRTDWESIVDDAYQDLAGRPPTGDERDSWTNRLALGLGTENDLIADLAMAAPYREPEGMALRAYVVTFGRVPSETVLRSLADDYREGGSTADLAALIVDSIDYEELRPSDPGSNLDRDDIAELADSIDVKHETWHLLQIVRAYRAAAGRLPTAAEIDAWTEYLQRGGLQVDVVAGALEGAMPSGEPRNAGVFTPTELGYRPGETVRQGPVDLDPSTDPGDGGVGTRTFGEPDFDVDLTVDEGEDGTDVASLTVRIPIDELAANSDGDAEITIELQLTPGVGIDGEAEASADIDVVSIGAGDESRGDAADDTAAARAADDDDSGPPVSPPTTRRPTPRPPTAPQPGPAPAPAPPSPSPSTTRPSPAPSPATPSTQSPEPSTTSTSTPTPTPASTPTTDDSPPGDGQPPTTCVPPTDPEPGTDGAGDQPAESSVDSTTTTTTSCETAPESSTDEAADPPTDDGSTTTDSAENPDDADSSDVVEGTERRGRRQFRRRQRPSRRPGRRIHTGERRRHHRRWRSTRGPCRRHRSSRRPSRWQPR